MAARAGFVAVLALAAAGCASLGLAPAQTPAQQLGYAYGGVTAALNTLSQAVSQGVVSSSEAATVNTDIMSVSSTLDTARTAICGTDPKCARPASSTSAVTIITAATASLAKISAYLTCRQAKESSCPLP